VSPFSFNLGLEDQLREVSQNQEEPSPSKVSRSGSTTSRFSRMDSQTEFGSGSPFQIARQVEAVVQPLEIRMSYQNMLIVTKIASAFNGDEDASAANEAERNSERSSDIPAKDGPLNQTERKATDSKARALQHVGMAPHASTQNHPRACSWQGCYAPQMIPNAELYGKEAGAILEQIHGYSDDNFNRNSGVGSEVEGNAPSLVYRHASVTCYGVVVVFLDDRSGHRIPLLKAKLSSFKIKGGEQGGDDGDEQELKAQLNLAADFYDPAKVSWTPLMPGLNAEFRLKRAIAGVLPVTTVNVSIKQGVRVRLRSQLVGTLVSIIEILKHHKDDETIMCLVPTARRFYRKLLRNQTGMNLWFWHDNVDPKPLRNYTEAAIKSSEEDNLLEHGIKDHYRPSKSYFSFQLDGYMPTQKVPLNGIGTTLLSLIPCTLTHRPAAVLMDVSPYRGAHLVTLKPSFALRNHTPYNILLSVERLATPGILYEIEVKPGLGSRLPLEYCTWDQIRLRAWNDLRKETRPPNNSDVSPCPGNEMSPKSKSQWMKHLWVSPTLKWDEIMLRREKEKRSSNEDVRLTLWMTGKVLMDRATLVRRSDVNEVEIENNGRSVQTAMSAFTIRAVLRFTELAKPRQENHGVHDKSNSDSVAENEKKSDSKSLKPTNRDGTERSPRVGPSNFFKFRKDVAKHWFIPTSLSLHSPYVVRNRMPVAVEVRFLLPQQDHLTTIQVNPMEAKNVFSLLLTSEAQLSIRLVSATQWSPWIPLLQCTLEEAKRLEKQESQSSGNDASTTSSRQKIRPRSSSPGRKRKSRSRSPRRKPRSPYTPKNRSRVLWRVESKPRELAVPETCALAAVEQKMGSDGLISMTLVTDYKLISSTCHSRVVGKDFGNGANGLSKNISERLSLNSSSSSQTPPALVSPGLASCSPGTCFQVQWVRRIRTFYLQKLVKGEWNPHKHGQLEIPSGPWRWEGNAEVDRAWTYALTENASDGMWKPERRIGRWRRRKVTRICKLVGFEACPCGGAEGDKKEAKNSSAAGIHNCEFSPGAIHTSMPLNVPPDVHIRLMPTEKDGSDEAAVEFAQKDSRTPLRMFGPSEISDPLNLQEAFGDGLIFLKCNFTLPRARMPPCEEANSNPSPESPRDKVSCPNPEMSPSPPRGIAPLPTADVISGLLPLVVAVRGAEGTIGTGTTKTVEVRHRQLVRSLGQGAKLQLKQHDTPSSMYPWLEFGDQVPMYWMAPDGKSSKHVKNELQKVVLVISEDTNPSKWFTSLPFVIDEVGDKVILVSNGFEVRVMHISVTEIGGIQEIVLYYEPIEQATYLIENTTKTAIKVRQHFKARNAKKKSPLRSFGLGKGKSFTLSEEEKLCDKWTWVFPKQRLIWGWPNLMASQPYQIDIACGTAEITVTMDNIGWSTKIYRNPHRPARSRRERGKSEGSFRRERLKLSIVARGVSKVLQIQDAWNSRRSALRHKCTSDFRMGLDIGSVSVVLGDQDSGLVAEVLLKHLHMSHHLESYRSFGTMRQVLNLQLGYMQVIDLSPSAVFPAPFRSPGRYKVEPYQHALKHDEAHNDSPDAPSDAETDGDDEKDGTKKKSKAPARRKLEVCLKVDAAWSSNATHRAVFESLLVHTSRESYSLNLDENFIAKMVNYISTLTAWTSDARVDPGGEEVKFHQLGPGGGGKNTGGAGPGPQNSAVQKISFRTEAFSSRRKSKNPQFGSISPNVPVRLVHVHRMQISLMRLELTFVGNSGDSELVEDAILRTIAAVFANLRNASIILMPLQVRNSTLAPVRLLTLVKEHYAGLVRAHFVSLVGSSAVLGNPVGLLKSVGTGVSEFFSKPMHAIADNKLKDVPISLIEGTGSLVGNVISGVGSSASGITDTLGRGMAILSMDKEHQKRRERDMNQNQPNLVTGVLMGGFKVIEGVARGVSGLVVDPVVEAKKGGVGGFFKGVGKGLLGAVTKPVGGAMDGVSKITQGVANFGKILRIEDKRRDDHYRRRAKAVCLAWESHGRVGDDRSQLRESSSTRGYLALFGTRTSIRCPRVSIAFVDSQSRPWYLTAHSDNSLTLQSSLGADRDEKNRMRRDQEFVIEYQDVRFRNALSVSRGKLLNESFSNPRSLVKGGWVAIRAVGSKKYVHLGRRGLLCLRDSSEESSGRLNQKDLFQIHNNIPGIVSTTIRCMHDYSYISVEKTRKGLKLKSTPELNVSSYHTFQVAFVPGSFIAFRHPFTDRVLSLGSVAPTQRGAQVGSASSAAPKMRTNSSGLVQTFKVAQWEKVHSQNQSLNALPVMCFMSGWMPRQGIIRALFGHGSKMVDVTPYLRRRVSNDGFLVIPGNTNCVELFGVDPAKGKPKTLSVKFRRGMVVSRWEHHFKFKRKQHIFVGKPEPPSNVLTVEDAKKNVHSKWIPEPAIVDGVAGFVLRSGADHRCVHVSANEGVSLGAGKSAEGPQYLFQPVAAYPHAKDAVNEADIRAATNLIPLPSSAPPTYSSSQAQLSSNTDRKSPEASHSKPVGDQIGSNVVTSSAPSLLTRSSNSSNSLHHRLVQFYKKHNPPKIQNARKLAIRYENMERELNAQLRRVYGCDLESL